MGSTWRRSGGALAALLLCCILCARAQTPVPEPDESAARAPHRIHLILKDGSFQIVTSYTIAGKIVRYVSAERGGAQEEIPTELVDLAATQRWEKQHTTPAAGEGRPPALDPELLKEEQERAALTPEVEPDLRLPEEDTLLALDYFQGTPELVPMMQSEGDLNRTTSHSIVKRVVNPRAAAQQLVTLRGVKSYVQLHVNTPVFYLRIGDEAPATTGSAPIVVDTHGASSAKINTTSNSSASRYVIVQADVRTDARVISSFRGDRLTDDVVETKNESLPGGHWIKLTPSRALLFGEYAIVEMLSDREINLGVWDFGVHPTAPENRDVLKPEPKKRLNLGRRRPD